jgi:hypothetical protein
MTFHHVKPLVDEFRVLSVRAITEDVTTELGALIERTVRLADATAPLARQENVKAVRGKLKFRLTALGVPESNLPHVLADLSNMAQRKFYQDAIVRLNDVLVHGPSVLS